jgi:hypothetical protein
MKTHLMTLVAVTCVLAGCTQSTAEPEAQGAALLAPFKQDLKSALVKGMESGPVAAIGACRTEAPMIAGRLAVDGVVMGRSSHKLRNPENVAPEWVAPLLVDYAAARLAGPVAIETTKGRFGYVEPIMIQPMCLNCHGSALHPDVEARIDELYPVDDAKGFSEGDFRGVFWVEFPQS